MTNGQTVRLNIFWIILKRHYKLLIFSVVIGTVLGGFAAFTLPKSYTASARVNVNTIVSDPFNPTRAASGLLDVATEEATAGSWVVAEQANKSLGSKLPIGEMRQNTTVRAELNATTVTISYTASTETAARLGADALANAYLDFRQQQADARKLRISDQLTDRIKTLNDSFKTATPESRPILQDQIATIERQLNQLALVDTNPGSVLNPASQSHIVVQPAMKLFLATGAVLGLVAGCLLAFLAYRLDRKIRDKSEIEYAGFSPVLADIQIPGSRNSVTSEQLADLFRTIRELADNSPAPIRTLALSDLGNRGFATQLAPLLGITFAQLGKQVEVFLLRPNDSDFPYGLDPYDFQLVNETVDADYYRSTVLKELLLVVTKRVDSVTAPDPYVTTFVRKRLDQIEGSVIRIIALPNQASESSHFAAARLANAVVVLVPYKNAFKADIQRFRELLDELHKPVLAVLGLKVLKGAHLSHAQRKNQERAPSQTNEESKPQKVVR